MISSPSESANIIVFENIRFIPKFERGHPEQGRFMRLGWVRTADFGDFVDLHGNESKTFLKHCRNVYRSVLSQISEYATGKDGGKTLGRSAVKFFSKYSKISNICKHNTKINVTGGQADRQTDRRTTCHGSAALRVASSDKTAICDRLKLMLSLRSDHK